MTFLNGSLGFFTAWKSQGSHTSDIVTGFPQVETKSLYDLMSEVQEHSFHCILLAKEPNKTTYFQGDGYYTPPTDVRRSINLEGGKDLMVPIF